jgi:hypothetical protein
MEIWRCEKIDRLVALCCAVSTWYLVLLAYHYCPCHVLALLSLREARDSEMALVAAYGSRYSGKLARVTFCFKPLFETRRRLCSNISSL